VVTFLGGFLFRLAYGLVRLDSAKQLESYLHAVIAGVETYRSFAERGTCVLALGVTRTRP
jgi:hypothetical protein